MHLNLVVLAGELASSPEWRRSEGGDLWLRLLLSVRSDDPHPRIDVLPVVVPDPLRCDLDAVLAPGAKLWVVGSAQRVFAPDRVPGPRSRVEVVALEVSSRPDANAPDTWR